MVSEYGGAWWNPRAQDNGSWGYGKRPGSLDDLVARCKMLTECLHLEEAIHGIRAMGLSPGTVATEMQRVIKASGINAVSQLDWSDHIPADWPAKALLWMCTADADEFLGTEISLRRADIRQRVGLT